MKRRRTAAVCHKCMDPVKVAKYFSVVQQVIDENKLPPESIWNMDGTGMQLEHKPGKVVACRGTKYLHSSTSGNREMVTVIAAVNAAGQSLPPHFIVKGKTRQSLQSFQSEHAPQNSTWSVSDSGWTKQGIALLWFQTAMSFLIQHLEIVVGNSQKEMISNTSFFLLQEKPLSTVAPRDQCSSLDSSRPGCCDLLCDRTLTIRTINRHGTLC